jgi:hypothetical protein
LLIASTRRALFLIWSGPKPDRRRGSSLTDIPRMLTLILINDGATWGRREPSPRPRPRKSCPPWVKPSVAILEGMNVNEAEGERGCREYRIDVLLKYVARALRMGGLTVSKLISRGIGLV